MVVNFDLPVDMEGKADCQIYLNRIERTGRIGKSGIAINLIDSPQAMEICNQIESHFGKKCTSWMRKMQMQLKRSTSRIFFITFKLF